VQVKPQASSQRYLEHLHYSPSEEGIVKREKVTRRVFCVGAGQIINVQQACPNSEMPVCSTTDEPSAESPQVLGQGNRSICFGSDHKNEGGPDPPEALQQAGIEPLALPAKPGIH
jgi:hypothetical protein